MSTWHHDWTMRSTTSGATTSCAAPLSPPTPRRPRGRPTSTWAEIRAEQTPEHLTCWRLAGVRIASSRLSTRQRCQARGTHTTVRAAGAGSRYAHGMARIHVKAG